ncbi:MAG: sodium:calcium antiporter [Candidatus Nealsonbacteria bacterium]
MIWLYILVFIFSCLVLVKSGAWLVRSLTRITKYLQMTEFVVAFILMAFATTIPELFVGIVSAFHGEPELSFGNVIGSNIINLTLAVGLGVLVAKGLKCEGAVIQRASIYTGIIALLPILLMLDGRISRVDGVILILALAFYIQRLFYHKERFTRVFNNALGKGWGRFKLFIKDFGFFFLGLSLLLLAAEGIVWSSSLLAQVMGLPLVIIGALIVALGTNLPEITFGIKAIMMGHKDMVLGNLLGAVVINSTLVLGITVLIHPLEIFSFSPYITGLLFIVFAVFFFSLFSRTGQEITRKEALFLIGLYLLFVVFELLL